MSIALFVIDADGGVTPANRYAKPYVTKWWARPFTDLTVQDWGFLFLFALALIGAAMLFILLDGNM